MKTLELAVMPPTLQVMPPHDPRKMTVAEAVERYIQMRMEERVVKLGTDHYRHLDVQLRRSLCKAIGHMPIADVKPDHIRAWLRGLINTRTGGELQPFTTRHYGKAAKQLFRRVYAEGWIDRDPCMPVVHPKVPDRNVNIVTAKQAFECFKVNVDHPAIARLALESFGGLRFSTAGRITKEAIKFDQCALEIEATIHKSQKRSYRQGQPACLWEWLREATDETWAMTWLGYRESKQFLHFHAGLRKEVNRYRCFAPGERERQLALKNVWRHSFASYLLALKGEFGPVAYLMQNSTAIVGSHYEGMATKDDARLYFAITPDAVRTMTWEQFKGWVLKPQPVLEPESVPRACLTPQTAPARKETALAGHAREDWRAG